MSKESSTKSLGNHALTAAKVAVCLSLLFVAAKAWAWLAGGSAALLSSLVDSILDAFISFTNLLAIRYALRPADSDHRFGHGKMEGVAALAQSGFIAGSCVFIVLEAVRLLGNPEPVGAIDASLVILTGATLLTLALTRYQAFAAKHSGSLAIEADAAHYTGDVFINIGVIASLLVGHYFNLLWIDPVVALLVGGWLLYTARGIGRKAIDMLLDREIEADTRNEILAVIRATPGVDDLHDLRTRRSGPKLIISFDIEVDPALTLNAAHDIAKTVEARLIAIHPRAEVMIHVDPRGDISDSRHERLKEFHAR